MGVRYHYRHLSRCDPLLLITSYLRALEASVEILSYPFIGVHTRIVRLRTL